MALESEGLRILQDLWGSGGRPEDLTPEQAPKVRAFFEEESGLGLWYFARVVCGLDLLTPHLHLEMCQILSLWGKPGWRRILMMVPRGSYKTSLGSKALPLWIATKDPEVTIGIFNAAQDQAKSWIGSIRQIVEGSRIYHMLWPERLPTGVHWRERDAGKTIPRTWKWGDTGMLFQRSSMAVSELTFEPYGIGGSSTGRHYTHRIMDDLIGETAATSPVLIEDAIHFVDHARALERPPNGGCELVNCTPWAYRDCYCLGMETRIWMADGSWKPIAEVEPGEWVVGYRKVDRPVRPDLLGKRGGARSRTELCVTQVVAKASRPGLLVTHMLEDGSTFRATENHRFFKVWKSGRSQSDYFEGKGLTGHDYAEVKDLVRLRKVMDPVGECPDPFMAGWLGGMYDADGSYARNTITICQSQKHYPEICQRIRDSLNALFIHYKEYRSSQQTALGFNEMLHFKIMRREDRTKFLVWCKPTKHVEKIRESLLGATPFHTVRIMDRSEPEPGEVFSIQTGTGNYIAEGLASKNSHMLQKWPEDYQVYRRSLLEDAEGLPDVLTGESIHPEAIPTDVARKMAETDYFTFASQYQCVPRASRETSFDPEWIRMCRLEKKEGGEASLRIDPAHYDPHAVHSTVHEETAPDLVPLHWCDRVLLIDPAPTKRNEKSNEPRARNGLVALAMDPWGRVFHLEDAALREDPVSVLERAVEMARRWKIAKVGIEEVNFSAVYAPLWTAILKHRYPNVELAFFPLRPKGEDKDTRIRRLQAPHREGLWYYRDPGTKATRQELLEYPSSETRDLIDAQSYYVQGLARPQTPGERERTYYTEESDGRDPFTHY